MSYDEIGRTSLIECERDHLKEINTDLLAALEEATLRLTSLSQDTSQQGAAILKARGPQATGE